jgi:hypothetical protein
MWIVNAMEYLPSCYTRVSRFVLPVKLKLDSIFQKKKIILR